MPGSVVEPEETRASYGDQSRPISVDDIFIPVMGVTGVGKTTFISTCTNDKQIKRTDGLTSDTMKVALHTMVHKGHTVHLVDTPGFNDTYRSESETLQELSYWLVHTFQQNIRISGIIYLHNITALRIQGSDFYDLNIFKAICGRDNYKSVVLATTRWEEVDEKQGKRRQQELCDKQQFWGELISKGAYVTALASGKPSALRLVERIIERGHRVTLSLQHQLVQERRHLHETDVGMIIYKHLSLGYTEMKMRMDSAKLDLEKATAEFHDRRMISAKNVVMQITNELDKTNAQLSKLTIDTKNLQAIWNKMVFEELKELEQRLDDTNARYMQKSKELQALRKSSSYSPSLEAQYESELSQMSKEKHSIEVVRQQNFRVHGGKMMTISTVVGTGLALGQFIGMIACTVM